MRADANTAARGIGTALAAALLLAGLGPTASAPDAPPARPDAPEAPKRSPAPQAPGSDAEPDPVRIAIGAIDLTARLVPIGLDDDGSLDEPPLYRTDAAGWYRLGSAPGERGPAVIVGHRDTRTGPSVFMRLDELTRGDTVRIGRADDSSARFRVVGVERVDKDGFPAARVYGPVDHAALRLVTCAGPFDDGNGAYGQNLIVYGRLMPG